MSPTFTGVATTWPETGGVTSEDSSATNVPVARHDNRHVAPFCRGSVNGNRRRLGDGSRGLQRGLRPAARRDQQRCKQHDPAHYRFFLRDVRDLAVPFALRASRAAARSGGLRPSSIRRAKVAATSRSDCLTSSSPKSRLTIAKYERERDHAEDQERRIAGAKRAGGLALRDVAAQEVEHRHSQRALGDPRQVVALERRPQHQPLEIGVAAVVLEDLQRQLQRRGLRRPGRPSCVEACPACGRSPAGAPCD